MNWSHRVSSRRCEQTRVSLAVLFKMNMTAVAYQAHLLFQNSICPMSQTSRTSGCRRQNSHSTRDLREGLDVAVCNKHPDRLVTHV